MLYSENHLNFPKMRSNTFFTLLVNSIIVKSSLVFHQKSDRPVIGIVAQNYYPLHEHSYIAASYVKFLEAAGARVVPVLTNQVNN